MRADPVAALTPLPGTVPVPEVHRNPLHSMELTMFRGYTPRPAPGPAKPVLPAPSPATPDLGVAPMEEPRTNTGPVFQNPGRP